MPEESFECIIAVDVAKDHLDYCVMPGQHTGRLKNTAAAARTFLRRHGGDGSKRALVVCEATGGYERALIAAAQSRDLPVHRAEGRRIRLFAQARGLRAKTDTLDARTIAEYASQAGRLRLYHAPPPERQALAALVDRREELLEMRLKEESRLAMQQDNRVRASLDTVIACLKRQLRQIEDDIAALIKNSKLLAHRNRLMQSLAGVGRVTAMTLMATMPELGALSKAQAAALAGLAPYNRDSGKTNLRRRLAGGRFRPRRCLFMAATVAIKHNPVLQKHFKALIQRGKPYKVALVAIMRKMIVILNAILKTDQPWRGANTT